MQAASTPTANTERRHTHTERTEASHNDGNFGSRENTLASATILNNEQNTKIFYILAECFRQF